MTDDDASRPWHLDRRVNIGHVFTTLSLAGAIFVWGSAMDRRVAVLEEKARAQAERDSAQDVSLASALVLLRNEFSDLRAEVRQTNQKIDRFIERRGAQ